MGSSIDWCIRNRWISMTKFSLSDVTVVSVCYNSDALINDMIASVPDEAPIVLVDNGQSNRFNNLPAKKNIQIVKLAKNIGFGRGCNAGVSVVSTPWALFLNPDARLTPGALEALLAAAKNYPAAVAFNPRIANRDGSAYFKRRSWLLPRKQYMVKGWPAEDSQVPVLSGAAFFILKENFNKVGGFDPNIFLYHEDDDISLRLSRLGQLMFVRDSLVVHAAGNSSGRSPEVARLKAFHMARSRIYTGIKHGRPFPRLSTFLQALALVFSPVALFSARRRAKAIGFLDGTMHWKER